MSKRGRKTVKAKDNKGYLDTNKDAFTDYKVITGNKITMEGVSGKIYAIPIGKDGKAGQGRLLKPGENHEFEGAAHVVEVPEVAMAKLGINTDPTKPYNNTVGQVGTTPALDFLNKPLFGTPQAQPIDPSSSLYNKTLNGTQPINPSNTLYNETLNGTRPATVPTAAQTPEELLASYEADASGQLLDYDSKTTQEFNDKLKSTTTAEQDKAVKEFDETGRDNWETKLQEKAWTAQELARRKKEGEEIEPTKKIQFDNPYGGVDVATAAQTLGASFSYDGEEKGANVARGVASGLKLLTGLGRNVMSGYAQNKRNQWTTETENEKQYNALTKEQFLQGGGNVGTGEGGEETAQIPINTKNTNGKVSIAELLTGSVVTGDPTVQPNVEVEGGEHIKDNQTGQVQEVVGNKHNQGGEPMNLPDHKVLSDYTKIGGDLAKKYRDEFDIKVKAKDTYSTVMDKVLKKTGYKSITEELTSTIEKTQKEQKASKDRKDDATTGINMQHLSGKINNLTKELEPLEQLKSSVFETLFEDQEGTKSTKELTAQMPTNVPEMEDGGDTTEEDNKRVSRERFAEFARTARRLGYDGKIDINATNLDAEAAKLQKFMVENHPDVAADYAKQNRITAKGLGEIKASYPYLFEQSGLDINKEPAEYSDDELAKLSSVATEQGVLDNKFWLDQFQDGLWRYRAPNVTSTSDTNMQTSGIIKADGQPVTPKSLMEAPNNAEVVDDTPQGVLGKGEREKGNGTGNSTLLLPDQHILPPSAMQPHRLAEITPREVEAKLISPNAQLEEINRQSASARAEINSLPDSQRRAALAQLNAQTQQSINQVMSQTNRANAQIEGQTEQSNASVANNAQLQNEQFANQHEQLQLTAKDKTENDIRNYFNAQNKKQVANYNTVQNLNLTNAMYDNFQYTGSGQVIQTGKGLSEEEIRRQAAYVLAVKEAKALEEEKKKTSKTTPKARRGRKTK